MKKRIIWLLAMLVALLCVLTVSAGAASGTCGDNVTWTLGADHVLKIEGSGCVTSCPWLLTGFEVESIVIADDVTGIGDSIFSNNHDLTSVVIGDGVKSIGNYAFAYCDGMTDVMLGKNIESIGDGAFRMCSGLTNVLIPNSVTSIGYRAFEQCENMVSLILGNSVTTIGRNAFYYCSKLTSVEIPDSVTTIGSRAFYCCNELTSIEIPDGVTTIEYGTFEGCWRLNSLTLGKKLKSVETYAFENCSRLAKVYYFGTVASWGKIDISSGNSALNEATIYYMGPEEPEVAVEVEGATPQFTIDTSALDGTDNYAVITVGGKTERVEQADWADGTVSYGGLAAKDLTQTVTMGVYDAEGTLLAEQSVSVADALKEQLKTETDTKEITKIKAMLHYGAAAQQYFGTNTENLANSGIGAMEDVSAHRKDDSLLKGKDFSMICGTSMVHEAVPQMKFYFTTDSKTVLVNGEEVELEASAAGYYTYTVDVAPEAFFETITVTVMDGSTVLATITDSVASYCARLHAQGGTLSKTLADALLNYGLAVKA